MRLLLLAMKCANYPGVFICAVLGPCERKLRTFFRNLQSEKCEAIVHDDCPVKVVKVSATACFWHLTLTLDFRPRCLSPLCLAHVGPYCSTSFSLSLSLSCRALNFVRAQRQTDAASVTPPSLFLPYFPPSL